MRIAVRPLAVVATSLLALLACSRSAPTYSKDVAPILQTKCQSCHRPGHYAAGPPGYYKHDIRLTDEEKTLIFEWADAGAPEGDPDQLPEPVAWDDSEWPLGRPDLVVRFPSHSPLPIYKDQFVTLVSDYTFPEDIWARALVQKTRSQDVVHHSTQFLWSPEMEIPEGRKTTDHVNPDFPLFTWFPGFDSDPLPPGQAIRLPKSWRIAARAHFAPTRERVSEEMEVGIYFADGRIDSVQKPLGAMFLDLRVPPGASDHTQSETVAFPEAAYVTHFQVHMHLRGKSSKIIFHYPDGTSQTVFDLPRYRFSWQRYYYLAEPLPVPEGTLAEFVGVWDNSENNPLNPDPTVWCRWGRKTVDEMFSAMAFYTPQMKLEKPLEVENGRLVGGSSEEGVSSPLL
jgi:hypothetical protein